MHIQMTNKKKKEWITCNAPQVPNLLIGHIYIIKRGYGAVIRNHEGLIMLAGAKIGLFSVDVDVDIANAKTLHFGIPLARDVGLSLLIIKFASFNVTQPV